MSEQFLSKTVKFSKSHLGLLLISILIVSFMFTGCATTPTGQKTTCGAVLGALAGAAIGAAANRNDPGRGALIGAAIGAVAGGVAGYSWGKSEERQLASRQQLEAQVYQDTGSSPVQPIVHIQNLNVNPDPANRGSIVKIIIVYQAYGPLESPPTATLNLVKDGNLLASNSLSISNLGSSEFTKEIVLPEDAASGQYEVDLVMQHGSSNDQRVTTFNLI